MKDEPFFELTHFPSYDGQVAGEIRCRSGESFWRHRERWDYVLKAGPLRLFRATDGECIARGPEAARMAQRLQKKGRCSRAMKVLTAPKESEQ